MDVVVVSDHSLAMSGAVETIRTSPDFRLRGVYAHPETLSETDVRGAVLIFDPFAHRDDVLVLPAADVAPAILVLTDRLAEVDVREALALGVRGYLGKAVGADTLLHAVNAVGHGGFYLDSQLDSLLFRPARVPAEEPTDEAQPRLTRRECEVLAMVANGLTHKEIGRQLGLSKATVDTYVYRISQKVRGGNKAALTRLAVDLQLVSGAVLGAQIA